MVNSLPGGLSEVFKHALKLFFGAPAGKDLRRGVPFNIGADGEQRLIVGRLGVMIQDERAHKFTFQCKGAGGHKLCCLCKNATDVKSALLPDPTGFLVSSDVVDVSLFQLHTGSSVRGIQRRLHEVALEGGPKTKLTGLQSLLGFNYTPTGALADEELDINLPAVFQWDWMHCYMVGGVFVKETESLLQRLHPHGMGVSALHAYVQHWQWPLGYGHAKKTCHNKLNGSASELMSLAPILGRFVMEAVPDGVCPLEVESCLALVRVVGLLSIVNSGQVQAVELGESIANHLALH